jgi:hypothetical protein
MVFMTDVTGRVASACDIVAVIMPRIVKHGPTRSRRASKVQTLIALAPSTLKVPIGAGYGGFMKRTEFIPKMPCFLLECGENVREIPDCVRQIVHQAAGGNP